MGLFKIFKDLFDPAVGDHNEERFRSLLVEIVELRTDGQDVSEDVKSRMVQDLYVEINNRNENRPSACLAEADTLYQLECAKIVNSPENLLSNEIARTLDQGWS